VGRVDPGKTVYVYGLHTEADKTIMYVGCSVNPVRRLKQHLERAMQGYAPKSIGGWITSCMEWGQEVAVTVLESCVASEAPQVETKWIKAMRSVNPKLLNEQRYSPYACHVNLKAQFFGLKPVSALSPGDTVIHMRRAYLPNIGGRGKYEPLTVEVIKSKYSNALVCGLVDGENKNYWVPKDCLYYPPTSP